jgi:hypothetical protein
MGDITRHLLWFVAVASVVAYSVYLLIGSVVNAHASGISAPVVVRDQLSRGAHDLSGMIVVPSTCEEVSVTSKKSDDSNYVLVFDTWEDPAIPCPDLMTPRVFRTTIFAPSVGVNFAAVLDGIPLPIAVYPMVHSE